MSQFIDTWSPDGPPKPVRRVVVLGPRDLEPLTPTEKPWRNPHARNPTKRYDAIGRRDMAKVTVPWLILAKRELFAQRTRRVPSKAVEEILEDESGSTALVHCPCERQPIVTEDLVKCPGCERWYLLVGRRVFVIYGEMDPP